jgi:hypothetical protein
MSANKQIFKGTELMSWAGETDQARFASGTVLALYHQPWGTSVRVPALVPGATIALRFPNSAVAQIDVVSVAKPNAVFKTPDGTQ